MYSAWLTAEASEAVPQGSGHKQTVISKVREENDDATANPANKNGNKFATNGECVKTADMVGRWDPGNTSIAQSRHGQDIGKEAQSGRSGSYTQLQD